MLPVIVRQFVQQISLKPGGHVVWIELFWKQTVPLVSQKDEDSFSIFV